MNKGLEALNRLLENDYFNLIISSRTRGKRQYANDIYIIEKELKALEIIKDRLIVVDKDKYIEVFCEFSIPSKSKKYDLLKEVLSNE